MSTLSDCYHRIEAQSLGRGECGTNSYTGKIVNDREERSKLYSEKVYES